MPKIKVTNLSQILPRRKDENSKYKFNQYQITDRSEFSQCFVAFYEIDPGSSNYPMHYHEANSEAFYIISGQGVLFTKDGEIPIKAGDAFVCPPGEDGMHKITNTSETEKLVYIDFDTTQSPDVVHYPDSNKIGVIIHGKSADFYQEGSKVDYYTGE